MSSHVQEDYPLVGSYGESRSKLFWVGVIAFLCWNILLFVLAVVAIAKVNDVDSGGDVIISVPPYQAVSLASPNGTIQTGAIVSLLADGSLHQGAGTSLYTKKRPPEHSFGAGAEKLRVARFPDTDYVVVVWKNATGTFLSIGVVSLDAKTLHAWGKPVSVDLDDAFSDVITLPNYQFMIVTPSKVYAALANTVNRTVESANTATYPGGVVLSNTHAIWLGLHDFVVSGSSHFNFADQFHANGLLLGNVIVNLDNGVVINWKTQTPKFFNSSSTMHSIFALDSRSFVTSYASAEAPNWLVSSMCSISDNSINCGAEFAYHGAPQQASYSFISTLGLTSTSGAIVFVDDNDDYTLKAVMVHETGNQINGLHYGSSLVLNTGVTGGGVSLNNSVDFLSTVTLGPQTFAVAYADYANNGKLTTAIISVDEANVMHSGPSFVIGYPKTLDDLSRYTVDTAPLSITSTGQLGYIIVDRENAWTQDQNVNFTIVEVANKPFGIATSHIDSGSSGDVAFSGIVDMSKVMMKSPEFTPGVMYFSTTAGYLVGGPYMGTLHESEQYVRLADLNTLVSLDSFVGVAVSKNELFVQLKI